MKRQKLSLSPLIALITLGGLLAASDLAAQQPKIKVKAPVTQRKLSPKAQVLLERGQEWDKLKGLLGGTQFSFNTNSCVFAHTIDPSRVYTNIPLKKVTLSYSWQAQTAKLTFNCKQGNCITGRAELAIPPRSSTTVERSQRNTVQGAMLHTSMRRLIDLCASDDKLPAPPSGDKA